MQTFPPLKSLALADVSAGHLLQDESHCALLLAVQLSRTCSILVLKPQQALERHCICLPTLEGCDRLLDCFTCHIRIPALRHGPHELLLIAGPASHSVHDAAARRPLDREPDPPISANDEEADHDGLSPALQ